jgi:putative NADH-flavin reductase
MKIAVIGATRGVGLALTRLALRESHHVSVLVRERARMPISHENLTIQLGDATDLESVSALIAGQDAVCLTLGIAPTRKPVNLFSTAARNVIAAAGENSTLKLVTVTGIGAGDSLGHGGFLYDRLIQPLLLNAIYEDKNREEEIVRSCSLEWLIVRPAMLTNGCSRGDYRIIHDLLGITASKISRADVADFMMRELTTPTCFRTTPLITY